MENYILGAIGATYLVFFKIQFTIKGMKLKLLILTLITATSLNLGATCLSDIYQVGVEANSVSYSLKENNNSFATHATTSATGLKLGRIWLCPEDGLEITAYGRFQYFTFEDSPSPVYSELNGSEMLFSGGGEVKKMHSRNLEWVGDAELRQDVGFSANYSNNKLESEKVINMKLMGGARYFIHSGKSFDVSLKAKAGILLSPADAGLGRIVGGSVEVLRRIGTRSSLKIDTFYDQYDQRFRNLDNSRKEVGLRLNLVFRF